MGAWIETCNNNVCIRLFGSHPTWVRGLKPLRQTYLCNDDASHPTWVRGLKLRCNLPICISADVAPYVGAWIETCNVRCTYNQRLSHPTWVRGLKLPSLYNIACRQESHPTWVRGLKHVSLANTCISVESHPTWVRGLKLLHKLIEMLDGIVAPYVGAWIETICLCQSNAGQTGRTLRGCVD